jgi:ArsR family transcriptional regulator
MAMNVVSSKQTETYADAAELFKVLTHPARLAILEMLRDGEECVCHMTAILGARQAYVSQQLMVLREAGMVVDRRDGWNIFYRVTRPDVYAVMDAARKMVGAEGQEDFGAIAHGVVESCPCPRCQAEVLA